MERLPAPGRERFWEEVARDGRERACTIGTPCRLRSERECSRRGVLGDA